MPKTEIVVFRNGLPAQFSAKLPRNREMLYRYLEGQTLEDIADYFDITVGTVRYNLSLPVMQEEMDRLIKLVDQNGVIERLKNLSPEALDTVRDTMRGANKSELKLKAASQVLDRNPDLAIKKDRSEELAQGLGESLIRAIGKRLIEKEQHETSENNNV